MFLGRTLNSHSALLHSGVYMGTSELNAEPYPTGDIPSHPAGGGGGGEGVVSRNTPSRFNATWQTLPYGST